MSGARYDPEQHGLKELIDQFATPSYDRLTEPSRARGRNRDAAHATFVQAITATVACQAQKLNPTEAALRANGGPKPDTMRRFLRGEDLSPLPFIQLDRTVDAGMIAAPCRMIVEARTEAATGPDRYGVHHLQPPSVLAGLWRVSTGAPSGAPNTQGGLSTAIVLAVCGGTVLPAAAVPIAQGHFDPENWPADARADVRRALQEREQLDGAIVTGPADIVDAMLQSLTINTMLAGAAIDLHGLPVTGGRLRLGYPLGDPAAGGGRQDRFLGCSLAAIRRLRESHLVPFLEIPAPAGPMPSGLCVTEHCDWRFHHGDAYRDLGALVSEALSGEQSGWRPVPSTLSGETRMLTLTTTAMQASETAALTLVLALGARGQRELFVTTFDPADRRQLERIVHLTLSELERRRPDSPVERVISTLLRDCYLQSNRRRRHQERRNFAGLAQAAYALARFSEVA